MTFRATSIKAILAQCSDSEIFDVLGAILEPSARCPITMSEALEEALAPVVDAYREHFLSCDAAANPDDYGDTYSGGAMWSDADKFRIYGSARGFGA